MQLRGWTRAEKADPGRDWYRDIMDDRDHCRAAISSSASPEAC